MVECGLWWVWLKYSYHCRCVACKLPIMNWIIQLSMTRDYLAMACLVRTVWIGLQLAKRLRKKFQSIQHFERFKYLHISWNNNVRFRLSHNFSFFYLSEMFIYSVHTRKEICFASAPIVSKCEPNEINVIVNRTKIIDDIVSWEMSALRRNQIDIFKT